MGSASALRDAKGMIYDIDGSLHNGKFSFNPRSLGKEITDSIAGRININVPLLYLAMFITSHDAIGVSPAGSALYKMALRNSTEEDRRRASLHYHFHHRYGGCDDFLSVMKNYVGEPKKLIAISGNPLAEPIAEYHGSYCYSNGIISDERGRFLDIDIPIKNDEDKRRKRDEAFEVLGLKPEQCVALVNSKKDLLMADGCSLVISAPGTKQKEVFDASKMHIKDDFTKIIEQLKILSSSIS